MLRKAIFLITFFSLFFTASVFAQEKNISIWQAKPLQITGTDDLPVAFPLYSNKGGFAYFISNDDRQLYIAIKCGRNESFTRMLQAGFTIWIDTGGKKNMFMGVHFLASPKDSGVIISDDQWAADFKDVKLEGFKDCNGMLSIRQENDCNVKIGLAFDENHQLIWKVILPFEVFYNTRITGADEGRKMSVGIVLNEAVITEKPEFFIPPHGMPLEPQPGADGGFGGGMGEESSPPAIGNMEVTLKAVKCWQPFRIAYKEK
jgi:hypothetical protein